MTDQGGMSTIPWTQWLNQALTPRLNQSLVTITLTGDVSGSGGGSFIVTINAGAVTLAKMAPLAATSIIGNNAVGSATPQALTPLQVVTMLPAGGDLSGTYNAPTTVGLRSKAIPSLSVGNLRYNGSTFLFDSAVYALDSAVVHNTGTETIAGAKTFSSPVDVPGVLVVEGANAKQGVATLVAGTVTVANTSITATSRIFLTRQGLNASTAMGELAVNARVLGTSFTITSYTAGAVTIQTGDLSTVAYEIFEVG